LTLEIATELSLVRRRHAQPLSSEIEQDCHFPDHPEKPPSASYDDMSTHALAKRLRNSGLGCQLLSLCLQYCISLLAPGVGSEGVQFVLLQGEANRVG